MARPAGQVFGNYRIVRLLGEGGFGEVHLAENPLLERRAAIKVLHAIHTQDKELVRRFLNEARAASAIRHPNIIDVLDAGATLEGTPYILMEFLEGASLQQRLADVGRLPLPQVHDIVGQVGSALAAAHAAGIVHRDLKPENLFLVPDRTMPGGERVKVLDFGIAKIRPCGSASGSVKTQSGLVMGSPTYMSPEQCKDASDVDLRSDIYSFAVIVYEMLAGRPPFLAASGTELLVMHLTETATPLRQLVPEVPAQVEAAIARALSRARNDRFDSMADFVTALGASSTANAAMVDVPAPSTMQPVGAARSNVGRAAGLPASTTFSRTTGEIGAADGDERPARTTPTWRRAALLASGAVVVALAIFMLVRPGRETTPRGTPHPGREIVNLAPTRLEPAALPAPVAPAPVALPGKPDAGAAPSIVPKLPAASKRQRAAAADGKPSPSKKRTEGNSDEEWVAH